MVGTFLWQLCSQVEPFGLDKGKDILNLPSEYGNYWVCLTEHLA